MTAQRRTERGIALALGLILALGFTLCGAFQVGGWTTGAAEHSIRTAVPGPVSEISVDARSNDVTIVAGRGPGVTVDMRAHGAVDAPQVEVSGGRASVRVGVCGGLAFWNCRSTVVVYVPAGAKVSVEATSGDISASGITAPVSLDTHSGDVTAIGLPGGADLSSNSGDIDARDLGGRLHLESNSGDVDGTTLRGDAVSAHSGSGDINLDFATPPDAVDADTASGDVDVRLPRGPERYSVDTRTNSGDEHIGVPTDNASRRVVRASTNSGDAVVAYGD